MESELLNNLNTNLTVIGSQCNVGKTTVLCSVVKEFTKKNKKILFVSDDNHELLIRKFTNLIGNIDNVKIIETKLLLELLNDDLKFDEVIIDENLYLTEENLMSIHKFCFAKSIGLTISAILIKHIGEDSVKLPDFQYSKLLLSASHVFIIDKKPNFSFFNKLKYIFLFWLHKPNMRFRCVKNRFGDNFTFNQYIELNINKIKNKNKNK
jgi:thymidine kinase